MVAELDGHQVGLVVDAANEVLKVNPELIEPPPNIFEQGELNYVTGVGKLGGKLVILIDLAKIMQRGELRRISDFAETAGAIPPAHVRHGRVLSMSSPFRHPLLSATPN